MSEISSEAVEAAAKVINLGSASEHVARAALTAALPYLVPEGTQPGCTGAPDCQAPAHVHGCYADTEGHCDDPHDHEDAAQQPARVVPSAEAIRKAITEADDEFDRLDPDAEEDWGDWEARAVLALFASQPTIQSVRDQVSEEILAVAHDYRLPKRPDEEQTGFTMRLVRADVLSDAARIARGETKGGE